MEDVWSDDEDFDRICEELLQKEAAAATVAGTVAAASGSGSAAPGSKKTKKINRFENLSNMAIMQDLEARFAHFEGKQKLSFSTTGFWCLFYDPENIEAAWDKMKALYCAGELFGVVKLSKATQVENRGLPILVFTGPAENKEHVMKVGQLILLQMDYSQQRCCKKFRRQQCSLQFERKIYYKIKPQGVLYELRY